MTNGNTLLGDQMLEMLVVLQMNREFMEFMRREYAEEIMKTQQRRSTHMCGDTLPSCTNSL